MKQYATNKWVRFGIAFGLAVMSFLAGFDWTTLVDAKTALVIAGAIGIIQSVIAAIAPGRDTPVATVSSDSLKSWVFTHETAANPTQAMKYSTGG